MSFGLTDLALHTQIHADNADEDAVPLSNKIAADTFFPEPPDTAWVAYFGHIMDGYDAGYYGYAWADAIAADMATVFEKAPDGFFDMRGRTPPAPGNLREGQIRATWKSPSRNSSAASNPSSRS